VGALDVYTDTMSKYDEWDDETFDLAADARDEARQAMQDDADDEFTAMFAATYECSPNNPECEWVGEFDESGLPYYWCEAHDA